MCCLFSFQVSLEDSITPFSQKPASSGCSLLQEIKQTKHIDSQMSIGRSFSYPMHHSLEPSPADLALLTMLRLVFYTAIGLQEAQVGSEGLSNSKEDPQTFPKIKSIPMKMAEMYFFQQQTPFTLT